MLTSRLWQILRIPPEHFCRNSNKGRKPALQPHPKPDQLWKSSWEKLMPLNSREYQRHEVLWCPPFNATCSSLQRWALLKGTVPLSSAAQEQTEPLSLTAQSTKQPEAAGGKENSLGKSWCCKNQPGWKKKL